jgi:hypothetical protein
MIIMKRILNLLALCLLFPVFQSIAQNSNSDEELKSRLTERIIDGVKIGTLMCEDSNGNMVICSGDEFEKVLGFATSIPYVTVNKRPKNQSQIEYSGIASVAGGFISSGDYLCPSDDGKLRRCEKLDIPYAKSISDASTENSAITVRILGSRRN